MDLGLSWVWSSSPNSITIPYGVPKKTVIDYLNYLVVVAIFHNLIRPLSGCRLCRYIGGTRRKTDRECDHDRLCPLILLSIIAHDAGVLLTWHRAARFNGRRNYKRFFRDKIKIDAIISRGIACYSTGWSSIQCRTRTSLEWKRLTPKRTGTCSEDVSRNRRGYR